MRKYAIRFLVSGHVAVSFALLLLGLAVFYKITTITIVVCLAGIVLHLSVSLQALWQLARNGHLITPIPRLLKM